MDRVQLSRSQRNLYHGVLQDSDPGVYLIGKSYRFHRLEQSRFIDALHATIAKNPVQLCVLEAAEAGADYPDLVPRLSFSDIVYVRPDYDSQTVHDADHLRDSWSAGILAQPLIRHVVRTDQTGAVSGLDVFTHHILLDGGATGIIEADLAYYLSADKVDEIPCLTEGLTNLALAHRREAARVTQSQQRLTDIVRQELASQAPQYRPAGDANQPIGTAAQGVLHESITLCGKIFDEIVALSATTQVPLNVLVAAAALAVWASLRQNTDNLLVHAVDNRFGEPDLQVATCLVNSVAHPVWFSPFASMHDVVAMLDRDYVRAIRRRWFREEQYRRMYLTINQSASEQALTLNFIREPCAPGLRRYLSEMPVATSIGPVEGMTVAAVLDEDQRTLKLAIWNRADLPGPKTHPAVADRIAAVLKSMTALWDQPIALAVNEWFGIDPAGAVRLGERAISPEPLVKQAWFLAAQGGVRHILSTRRYVYSWVWWLVRHDSTPGDVMVFTDDNTDKTIDLLIGCHLAGCGYSVCGSAAQAALRADSIASHSDALTVQVIDVAATELSIVLDDESRALVDQRIAQVTRDPQLGSKTAYIMATSGSTGTPKLVPISHRALALFCTAASQTYGWRSDDTILQCAPLTSDISVEEIFVSAVCGSQLLRSTALHHGDLTMLAQDCLERGTTVLDLPTAVWHLWCEDSDALAILGRSRLRQIVIGGEAIRPSAVDKWLDTVSSQAISLVSSYGPTETTVVVSQLPIITNGKVAAHQTRLRVGQPMLASTVFIAFGEVVIVGEVVSAGYLGLTNRNFGKVTTADGGQRQAFATADRVLIDDEGFPVFAGRKDAVVKISGNRIDTAEVIRRILEDPVICDIAVELRKIGLGDGLGVWFQTQHTRAGEDADTAARIRRLLVRMGVASFFVFGVPHIPRQPNGAINSSQLPTMPLSGQTLANEAGASDRATGLAELWSHHLGRTIRPESSLLAEGIGSLDLIRILPDTRRYLQHQLSLLDLIGADCAAELIRNLASASVANTWPDADTAAQLEHDLATWWQHRPITPSHTTPPASSRPEHGIVVLGASGILGTGFAQAVLDLHRSGMRCPEVVFATRSALPERDPWVTLRNIAEVRIEKIPTEFGSRELDALITNTDAQTLINCIGNTHVLVPYRTLRSANVELVATITQACANHRARLVHLSTFVVNADVTLPRVTDPRDSPYPYAASKSLAELVIAAASPALDFTIVRLPRVLGTDYQVRNSTDILVSVVDACLALAAYPSLALTEEVTTGRAAAQAVMGLLPELAGSVELGRGITVMRGEPVGYADLLRGYGLAELDITEWKYRLDRSDWAKRHPRRWSVVDAWISLGSKLGTRSYAEYLADYPSIDLGVKLVTELAAPAQSIRDLVMHGCRHG
ncbi:MAG: AMP-binding protein [Mycobacteriaceae bacterium]|nr:AMP-binding protein [Mycobacteriaceae bacterium]